MISGILKHLLMFTIIGTGLISLLAAVGDETSQTSTFAREMASRTAALAVSGVCALAGRWCHKRNYFPPEFYADQSKSNKQKQ